MHGHALQNFNFYVQLLLNFALQRGLFVLARFNLPTRKLPFQGKAIDSKRWAQSIKPFCSITAQTTWMVDVSNTGDLMINACAGII